MMRSSSLLCLLLAGCGSSETSAQSPADSGAPDTGSVVVDAAPDAPPPIPFSLCPAGYSGACLTLDVPLDHDAPTGKKIKVLVNRVVSVNAPKGQLYMLQGGPGGSATDLVPLALALGKVLDGFEIYTVEHRGVGASGRLGCKGEGMWTSDAEVLAWWQACHQELIDTWGEEGLHKFDVTQAARDLGLVIDKIQKPGLKKYVYGISYGTLWAQRYLQVRPEQPDGVVLDSVVDPTAYVVSHQDASQDVGAKLLAEACKKDATCASLYGDDPWARVQEHVAKVKANTCVGAPPALVLGFQANAMLQNTELMPLLLPLLHRYSRCSPGDVAVLKKVDEVFRGFMMQNPRFSQAMFYNVGLSELFERPIPSEEELRARADAVVFPSHAYGMLSILAFWKTYPADQWVGKIPTSTKPVLLLNGTLDVQTLHSAAAHVAESFTAPGQQFVSIPNANHSILQQSMTAERDQPACGQDIVVSWLKTGKADTSCIPRVVGPTFTPDPGFVNYFFGRTTLWDDPISTGGAASFQGPLPPHVKKMIDDVARRIRQRM